MKTHQLDAYLCKAHIALAVANDIGMREHATAACMQHGARMKRVHRLSVRGKSGKLLSSTYFALFRLTTLLQDVDIEEGSAARVEMAPVG